MNLRNYILSVLLLCAFTSHAQIGARISQLTPYGDIGEYFKKGTALEIYYVATENRLRERFGILYSHLAPRLDTFPIYGVKYDAGSNTTTILPGILVNRMLDFYCINADFDYKVIQVKSFSLYLGAGIIGGKTHTEYVRTINTVIDEIADVDILVAGFKACVTIDYKASPHLDLYAETSYNGMRSKDWSTSFTNTLLSIGVNYSFKKFDDE
jgi:hypothetical protein